MKLKEIAIGYIEIPLVTPFKTALRTVNSVNDLIVKVTAEDGTEGYGEAPPTAVITGDTKESIEAAIRYYIAPSIKDMDLDDLPAIMAKMEKCLAKNTTAKAAVDIALYDLYAKLQKKPLFRLLGEKDPSAVKTELETDITISVNDTDEMVRDSVKAVGEGFRVLKVKVGKGGEKDVERIREIRKAVGKDVVIRVDANQGWTREEAVSTITAMEDAGLGIELVEQPVSYHDFKGMQYVTAHVQTPILADESVFSYEDGVRVMEEHGADLVNIKLMKTGGIHEAVKICDAADKFGIKCMIGCMLESKVSVSAGVHLAAARSCVTMADLDGPSLCKVDPYEGGPIYQGSKILLKEDYGIGISKVPVNFENI
nr:dipeptide epimerase [uncultured Blautia sp.]